MADLPCTVFTVTAAGAKGPTNAVGLHTLSNFIAGLFFDQVGHRPTDQKLTMLGNTPAVILGDAYGAMNGTAKAGKLTYLDGTRGGLWLALQSSLSTTLIGNPSSTIGDAIRVAVNNAQTASTSAFQAQVARQFFMPKPGATALGKKAGKRASKNVSQKGSRK